MRAWRKLAKLCPLLTLAVVVTVALRERGSFPAGLGGAVVGLLLELATVQVGILLGALVCRLRVRHVIIGVGAELTSWTSPQTRITVCRIPLVIRVGVRAVRHPVRRWLWLTSATSVLVGGLTVGAAWSVADSAFGRGLALGATACLLHELQPRRDAKETSPGWFLFLLPWLTGRPAEEMDATPLVDEITDAVRMGDLDTAEAFTVQLVERHPTLLLTAGAQVMVLGVRGRHAEAMHLVSRLVGRTDLEPRDLAFVLAEMSNAAASAAEAGQLPMEIGLPAARRAAGGAMQLGFPRHRFAGTLAQLALLEGDTAKAVQLARQSADGSESQLGRADALATIARAQMADGDNAAARVTIVEARTLAGWLPRVAETTARLSID